jgi:arylformamidase
MKVIDISTPLVSGMAVYEGDPPCTITSVQTVDESDPDSYALSMLHCTGHTGTHIDAPKHFAADGVSVDRIPIQLLCGPARVLDLRGVGLAIRAEHLRARDLSGVERLLLRTDNGSLHGRPFCRDYSHLTESAATMLRNETRVRLVGIDYLSIDGYCRGAAPFAFPAHRALLSGVRWVAILEGIDLREASEGDYELWCLPLRVADGDGAPARALLVSR